MTRSILPAFMRPSKAAERLSIRSRRSRAELPPTPSMDRWEPRGVSLVALAQQAMEAGR